jgi:TonB family protein
VAIAVVTGISALLFLGLSLAGKVSDRFYEFARLNPARARQISIMVLVACSGASHLLDRVFDRPEQAQSLKLDQGLKVIRIVHPVYPPLARQNRVPGTVRLKAVIGVNGQVKELKLIAGNPLLVPAALEAASQWTFSKPTAGGKPVELRTELGVNFQLSPPK